jgi:hypothetical protein
LRRQIALAPKALRRAGEHGLGARTVAAKVVRQAHNAVEIGARRHALVFIYIRTRIRIRTRKLALQLALRFPRQILNEDRVFLVGFVARSHGLKVETESARCRIFELG